MIGTSLYMIVFRLLHVLAGVVWVGGVFLLVAFVQPGAASLGPSGGPFVQELLGRRRLPIFLLTMGGITIAAGLFLYWRDWQLAGSFGNWVGSSYGLVLTVGSLAAILAFLVGLLGVKPTLDRALRLGAKAAASGEPPTESQAEMRGLQARARRLSQLVLTLLVIAVLAMATARYW